MMICKHCKKNVAKVRFTEVVDGQAVHHNLCPECYEAWQRDASGFTLDVPKPTRHSRKRGTGERKANELSSRQCSTCGVSLMHIMENAAVGCASCYTQFGEDIESILEGLHRSLIHRGKSVSCDDERARLAKELQGKRFLLRSMLKEENYEEAARLRDEIARIEDTSQNLKVSFSGERRP